MRCPKCSQENAETAQFCLRCHAPLRFICPACKHVQDHGGTCDKCGVDFAKFAAVMMFKVKDDTQKQRERLKTRASIIKQIVLLPLTGGYSLIKFLLSRFQGD